MRATRRLIRRPPHRVAGATALVVLLAAGAARATTVTYDPATMSGITLNQYDFLWAGAETPDSTVGQIYVDAGALTASTMMSTSFINVFSDQGWVVQNLAVFGDSPYAGVQTSFNLGAPPSPLDPNVSQIEARVEVSDTPVTTFSGPTSHWFDVGDTALNAQGKGGLIAPGFVPLPHPVALVKFKANGRSDKVLQPNHTVVETADNQCGPEAIASSLQYLGDTYKVKIPHDHKKGLKGDETLVGKLDTALTRGVVDRAHGDTVQDMQFLTGKLRYLGDNKIPVVVKHQDDSFGDKNVKVGNRVSVGKGKKPTADFIFNELKHGEDVEMGYSFGGGGHWVEVVGAGFVLGVPWVQYVSDHEQTARDKNGKLINDDKGIGVPDMAWLVDSDGDGLLNLVSDPSVGNVDIVVTQSVSEPSSALLLVVAVPFAGVAIRRRGLAGR